MRRARHVREKIEELRRRKSESEKHRKKFVDYLQRLKNSWIEKEIKYFEYEKIISKKHDGKTIPEWIHYYDNYIVKCEELILKEGRKIFHSRIFIVFVFLALVGVLIFSVLNFQVFTGLTILGETESYSDSLDLSFENSDTFIWEISNSGTLISAELTGRIKGDGSVKIYLEDLLILDSDNINELKAAKGITGNTVEEGEGFLWNFRKFFGILGIIGRTIDTGEESDSEDGGDSTEDSSPSQDEPPSSEEEIEDGIEESEPVDNSESDSEDGGDSTEDSSPSQDEPPSSEEEIEDGIEESEPVDNSESDSEDGGDSTEDSSPSQDEPPSSEEEIEDGIEESEESEESEEDKDKKEVIEFSNLCEETCDLKGLDLDKRSYILRIEISGVDAEIELDKIDYKLKFDVEEIGEEVSENVSDEVVLGPPSLIKDIPDIEIEYNSVKKINLNEYFKGGDDYFLLQIENISTRISKNILELIPDESYVGTTKSKILVENDFGRLDSNEFIIIVKNKAESNETIPIINGTNVSISTWQYKAVINRPVKWIKNISLEDLDTKGLKIKIPKNAENISIRTGREVDEALREVDEFEVIVENLESADLISGTLTGNVALDIGSKKGLISKIIRWFKGFTITGNVIQETELTEDIIEVDDAKIVDLDKIVERSRDKKIAVEYYTSGPTTVESLTNNGKRVVVSGDDKLNITDVLAFTQIEEKFNVGEEGRIKIYWNEENKYVDFNADDIDGDGKIDYVEWIVPHLSDQTFDIILITKAEHLDNSREFISDIFEEVKELDGNWSEEIPNGHYVRVTFERPLDNTRDISIFPRIVTGNPRVEIYEVNSTSLIAEFTTLTDNDYNKVYLVELNGEQDTFDLRVIGGSIELEHIIDPVEEFFEDCESLSAAPGVFPTVGLWQAGSGGDSGSCHVANSGGASTNMTSAVIDLSGKTQANVSFNTLHNNLDFGSDYFRFWVNSSVETWQLVVDDILNEVPKRDELSKYITLDDGVHLRFECANDHNNEDCKVDNINITTPPEIDTVYPIFTNFLEVPANNTNFVLDAIYEFNVTLHDSNGTVGMEFDGVNYTATNLTGNNYNVSIQNLNPGTYSYYWFAWGNGTDNNYNVSDVRGYSIIDDISPNVTINLPQNVTYTNDDFPLIFNVSLYENGSVQYSLDSGATNISMTGDEGGAFGKSFTSTNSSMNGSYEFRVYANDTSGNVNNSVSINFSSNTVTVPPNINFVPPTLSNSSISTNNFVEVNVSIVESGLQEIIYNWNGSNYTLFEDYLVLFMNFDNRSALGENGTFVTDLSNNGNNGTFIGNGFANESSGYYSGGAQFDGNGDYVEILDSDSLDVTVNFSISLWFKSNININATSNNASGLVRKEDAYGVWWQEDESAANAGKFRFGTFGGNIRSTTNSWENDTWYHIVAVHEGSNSFIYVNGELDNSLSNSDTVTVETSSVYIGFRNTGPAPYFNGTIDDVMILNRTLRADEVTQLYFSSLTKYNSTDWNLYVNQSFNSTAPLNDSLYYHSTCGIDNNLILGCTDVRYVNITSGEVNVAPEVITVFNNSFEEVSGGLNAGPLSTVVYMNFSAYDADGASDLDLTTATLNFSKAGETTRQNVTCAQTDVDGNYANFSCNIEMWWWDGAGAWDVTAYIEDASASGQNGSADISVGETTGLQIGPTAITWPNLAPGQINISSNNDPILINNTGNDVILLGEIGINATNLLGEEDNNYGIWAGNISVGPVTGGTPLAECNGTATVMSHGIFTNITGAVLPADNYTINNGTAGQEKLYLCINIVGAEITSQPYSSSVEGSWTIRILLAAIIPRFRKKKKKNVKDDALVKALRLIMIEIRDNYSVEKELAMNALIKDLRERYKVNRGEIIKLVNIKMDIPLSIFSKDAGGLEMISKFMKENLGMNYSEIARELSRNERTIWTAYNKAVKKKDESIRIKEGEIIVPFEVFRDRKLTVLESLIVYLRGKDIGYSEIAKLIDRDERNVWTIYSRAVKKLGK